MFRTIYSWILELLVIVIICSSTSCIASNQLYDPGSYRIGMARKELIITVKIDQDFPLPKRVQIQRAFDTWERATQYKLQFKLLWDQPKPGLYYLHKAPKLNDGNFFWNLPKYSSEHLTKDISEDWQTYLGVMVFGEGENSGNIIVFEEVSDERFYAIALHEAGHFIGLVHSTNVAVMHSAAISNCLVKSDVEQLCNLYGCQPIAECEEKKEPVLGEKEKIKSLLFEETN